MVLSAETAGGVTRVTKVTTSPPVIDGIVDAVYYDGYTKAIEVVQTGEIESAEDCSAVWHGLYDDEKLYLFIDITDQYVTSTDGDQQWTQDLVELYFNLDNLKPGGGNGRSGDNFQISFNVDMPDEQFGSNASHVWPGIEWVQLRTETGWALEIAIEWSALPVAAPVPGLDIGFDIAVVDNDGSGSSDSILYWHNSRGGLWGNIDGAGTIVLGDVDRKVLPKIATTPVIDGAMDDILGASGGTSIQAVQSRQVDGLLDCSGTWYGAYTDEGLYVLVDIVDDLVSADFGTNPWDRDRIEVFFNMDNAKPDGGNGRSGDNFQYAFNFGEPDATHGAGTTTWSEVEWSHTATEDGWLVEILFKWAALGISAPAEGDDFGFDIAVNDNDGGTGVEGILYWHNTTRRSLFSSIDGAGTVVMGAAFDGNYPPALDALDPVIAVENVASTFVVEAADLNAADQLVFSADALPAFLDMTDNGDGTATVSINSQSGDVGSHQFPVTVSDGNLSDTILVTVLVQPASGALVPEFSAIDSIDMPEGDTLIQDLFVTDLDSRRFVSIAASSELPSFASLLDSGDGTARLTLDPSEGEGGQFDLSFEAIDESGNVGTLTINLSVNAQWRGYPMNNGDDIDTGNFLGWINVQADPWIYQYTLGWLYYPETGDDPFGGWVYFPKQ